VSTLQPHQPFWKPCPTATHGVDWVQITKWVGRLQPGSGSLNPPTCLIDYVGMSPANSSKLGTSWLSVGVYERGLR